MQEIKHLITTILIALAIVSIIIATTAWNDYWRRTENCGDFWDNTLTEIPLRCLSYYTQPEKPLKKNK